MNDKIERGRMAVTYDEWFEYGPSLYGIEQLQAARNDLDRILKLLSARREQVADEETDTALYQDPTEQSDQSDSVERAHVCIAEEQDSRT